MAADKEDFLVSDTVTDAEGSFPFKDLMSSSQYFKLYREGYYKAREVGLLNKNRNYLVLLGYLGEIYGHDQQHAKAFAKRLREQSNDFSSCEAVFAEIIVYRNYIRYVHEGLLRRIELNQSEADLILERGDGTRAYLEVFCVMPNFPAPEEGGFVTFEPVSHTQTAPGSIRQKLLSKIHNQKQFTKPRENYAVIELNDISIAGDFAVLSSLSGGYKLQIGLETRKVLSEGYDWDNSVFANPSTKFLKAVVWFSLGDYGSRKFLFNPRFKLP